MRFSFILITAAVLLTPAANVQADGPVPLLTRTAPAEAPRPKAQLSELAWLVGQWEGPGISGAVSQETWSRPLGGAMAGTFVQTDDKGGVMFSEYMQIVPDGESLTMRLKHFNADLTGWEEKEKSITFRLIAHEGAAWYFNGLTYQREGRERLLVAVRMRGKDGAVSELVFRFRRLGR
jgi:Domain of unknown function (DUF6265)